MKNLMFLAVITVTAFLYSAFAAKVTPQVPSVPLSPLVPIAVVALLKEDRISLNQLAREEGVSPSTVWRWTQRGVRGIKMEAISVAGRRCTTRQAFARWVEATNAARDGEQPSTLSRTNRQRAAAVSQAERELDEAGV